MPDTIVQLSANDYDPALAFLDRVFGEHRPHDFRHLLPAIYQPTDEHMRCNYAIQRDGHIKAIVGVFPITQCVGPTTLRIAGIGGVSVDPACRGEGLMRILMDHAVREIDHAGYDLSWLGGQRQRYRYWGYEVGGTTLKFTLDKRALKHDLHNATPLTLHHVTHENDPHLRAMHALHNATPTACIRTAQAFPRHLRNHHHTARAGLDGQGRVVAYASTSSDGSTTSELVAATPADTLGLVRALAEQSTSQWPTFHTPALPGPVSRALSACADNTTYSDAYNWRIKDWPKVVNAWLTLQHAHAPRVRVFSCASKASWQPAHRTTARPTSPQRPIRCSDSSSAPARPR